MNSAAQIVDAVGVVGVLVGVEHAVEPIDVGIEQLLAQVRRGVDQDARDAAAGRAARPAASSAGGGSSDCSDRRRPSRAPGAARRRTSRSQNGERQSSCGRCRRRARHLARTAGRNSRWSGARSRRTRRRAPRPAPSRSRPRKPARCACRDSGTGARYGASVSTRMRSAGTPRRWRAARSEFLKVRMPVNEM